MSYNDDIINSSREKNGFPPPWTDLILNPEFEEAYLKKSWPRICLYQKRGYRQSHSFLTKPDEELNIKQQPKCSRFLICFIWWCFVALAITATLLTVLLLKTKEDKPTVLTEYVKVDMNMTVNSTYLNVYDNKTSPVYTSFTNDVCSMVRTAYKNDVRTQSTYYGCRVTSLSAGSIVVVFTLYFSSTSEDHVRTNVQVVMMQYIQSNANNLGQLYIVKGSINVLSVTTIKIRNPPIVQGSSMEITPLVSSTVNSKLKTTTLFPSTAKTTNRIITTKADPTTVITEDTINVIETAAAVSSATLTMLTDAVTNVISHISRDTVSHPTSNLPTGFTVSSTLEHSTFVSDPTQTTKEVSPSVTEQTTSIFEKTSTTSPSIETETSPTLTDQSSTLSKYPTITTEFSSNTTLKEIANTEQLSTKVTTTKAYYLTSTMFEFEPQSTDSDSKTGGTKFFTSDSETASTFTGKTTRPNKTTLAESIATTTTIVLPTTTLTESSTMIEPNDFNNTWSSTVLETTPSIREPTAMITTAITATMQTQIATESSTLVTEPTASVNEQKINTESTTRMTEPMTSVTEETDVTKSTLLVTAQTTLASEQTIVTKSTSILTEPTTLITEQTIATRSTILVTEPTTPPPDRTIVTEFTMLATELPTSVTERTTVTESIMLETQPNTSVTEQTTVSESTHSVTDSTASYIKYTTLITETTPGTTQTVTVDGSTYVSCQDKTIEVDSEAAEILCTLNGISFSTLNITFRSSAENVARVIAQIEDNGNVKDLVQNDNVAATLNTDIVIISVQNLSCNTGDFYGVSVVDGDTVVGSSSGKLIVGSRPKMKPILNLHPDQVEGLSNDNYKNDLYHSCNVDLGFPAGETIVQVLKEKDTQFIPLDIWIEPDNTTLDEQCTNNKDVKFEIRFTSDMNNAIIRCGVKNQHFQNYTTLYSNNETVSLISNFCVNDTSGKVYFPHPTDCESYVHCHGNQTQGERCPVGLCFGVATVSECDNCNHVTCPYTDVISTLSTTLRTTTEEMPSGIKCEDKSTLIFSENLNLVCIINQTVYERIDINFVASVDSSSLQVANISNTKEVTVTEGQENYEIQFDGTVLNITVRNVSCENDGHFSVYVYMADLTVSESARLTVLAKPSGSATLTIHPHQIIGISTVETNQAHTCQADIGNPPGTIMVEMRLQGDNDFRNITNLRDFGSLDYTPYNCTLHQTYKFYFSLTIEMDNATLRCTVSNNNYPSMLPIHSNNENLALIPDNFCVDKNDSSYSHPTANDCNRFVDCVNNKPVGKTCETEKECFDSNIGRCNHCNMVDNCS